METISAALLLFLIMDPLGNIPVFLSLLKPLPKKRQRVVLARELLIAFFVLLGFLWGGMTMGMLLSVPLMIAGVVLIGVAMRRPMLRQG